MRLYNILISASLLALVSCGGGGDDPTPAPEATITAPDSVMVNAGAGEGSFEVTASDSWEAYSNTSWISNVSPEWSKSTSGTVTFSVDENLQSSKRIGTIVIKCGTTRHKVPVVQAPHITDENIATPEGYHLVWHDEFESGDRPDTKLWYYETGAGGWGNNEIQNYVSPETPAGTNLAKVSGGILTLTCLKEEGQVYSIRVNTKEAWTYGYFEASLKLPSGKGTWPAFWMMPKNFTSWPEDGEIDIMEEVGYNANYCSSTVHCKKYNNGGTAIEHAERKIPTAQSEFHTYALEWTPDYMIFYIDGEKLLRYDNDKKGYDSWPFDNPFYLKLNLAWGGNWGGAQGVDESCLPADYQIDYVRVFQKDE